MYLCKKNYDDNHSREKDAFKGVFAHGSFGVRQSKCFTNIKKNMRKIEINIKAYQYALKNHFDISDANIKVPFEHLRKFWNALDKDFANENDIENCIISNDFCIFIPIEIFEL